MFWKKAQLQTLFQEDLGNTHVTSPISTTRRNVLAGLTAVLARTGFGATGSSRTPAEVSASVSPIDLTYPEGHVLRYGSNSVPGTTDMTSAIQAAIDVVYAGGGGTVRFPSGLLLTNSLWWKFGVSLSGAGIESFSATTPNVHGTWLKLKSGANAPMIQNDLTTGPTLGAFGSGIDGHDKRGLMASVENIVFDGNFANQTTMDADVFRLRNCWGAALRKIGIRGARGFGIRLLDCNAFTLADSNIVASSLYLESMADSSIRNNQMGGGVAPIYPIIWISGRGGAGPGGWESQIRGNFIYNNANNVVIHQPTFLVQSGASTLKTSTTHGWSDGTPVVATSTGVLPAPLVAGKTYYWKTLSATSGALATSRASLASGRFMDFSTDGSGTHTIGVGEDGAIYCNDDVHWMLIAQNRIDQNYGAGIFLRNSYENVFDANLIHGCGMSTEPTARAGVVLRASSRNTFRGNDVNGTTYASAGRTSRQTIGFDGDLASRDNIGDLASQARNHLSNDVHMLAGYKTDESHETLFLDATRFSPIDTGTQSKLTVAGSSRQGWPMEPGRDVTLGTSFRVPSNWAYFSVQLLWLSTKSSAGSVYWTVSYEETAAGQPIMSGAQQQRVITTTGPAQRDLLAVSKISTSNVFATNPADYSVLTVQRSGTNASDTLASEVILIGALLSRSNPK